MFQIAFFLACLLACLKTEKDKKENKFFMAFFQWRQSPLLVSNLLFLIRLWNYAVCLGRPVTHFDFVVEM
jgi:hypothetical protein